MHFEVIFYTTEEGESPIDEFLLSLDIKMRAKMTGLIELLEEKGNELRLPYSEYLVDSLFELRCKQGTNISRVIYFFYYGGKIVLTNGFVKKQQKTPKKEIRIAMKRREDYIKRHGDNNENV